MDVGERQKATKGLTTLSPEIDSNQSAMGLPPVTFTFSSYVSHLVKCGCLLLLPLQGSSVSGMYVSKNVAFFNIINSIIKIIS
jgi:hypothetical protein